MSNSKMILPRRKFLSAAALGGGGLLLSGCDALTEQPEFTRLRRQLAHGSKELA